MLANGGEGERAPGGSAIIIQGTAFHSRFFLYLVNHYKKNRWKVHKKILGKYKWIARNAEATLFVNTHQPAEEQPPTSMGLTLVGD